MRRRRCSARCLQARGSAPESVQRGSDISLKCDCNLPTLGHCSTRPGASQCIALDHRAAAAGLSMPCAASACGEGARRSRLSRVLGVKGLCVPVGVSGLCVLGLKGLCDTLAGCGLQMLLGVLGAEGTEERGPSVVNTMSRLALPESGGEPGHVCSHSFSKRPRLRSTRSTPR